MAVNVIIERFRTLGTQRERFLPDGDDAIERACRPPAAGSARLGRRHGPRVGASTGCRRAPAPVFVLHDVEGYKHEEIGTLLGVSVGHLEVPAAPRPHDPARPSHAAEARP